MILLSNLSMFWPHSRWPSYLVPPSSAYVEIILCSPATYFSLKSIPWVSCVRLSSCACEFYRFCRCRIMLLWGVYPFFEHIPSFGLTFSWWIFTHHRMTQPFCFEPSQNSPAILGLRFWFIQNIGHWHWFCLSFLSYSQIFSGRFSRSCFLKSREQTASFSDGPDEEAQIFGRISDCLWFWSSSFANNTFIFINLVHTIK